jgi:hypothetical protein
MVIITQEVINLVNQMDLENILGMKEDTMRDNSKTV